jgi:O-antigen biosynthesis protein
MKFTGERYVPSEQGRIRLEHYHRYAVVQKIVSGKDVLDIASGEGYGSSLLAEVALSVTGVDISDEAVSHAIKTYKKPNLRFQVGSAIELAFPTESFDIVVSYETVEHLAEQSQMIAELRRVLRPDGLLIISSPNRPIYSEESGELNEHHVKELNFEEFDSLLSTQFPSRKYFGQRLLLGSVIQALDEQPSTFKAWHDDGKQLIPKAGEMDSSVYFLAVCAVKPEKQIDIDMSILYPGKLDLVKHYVGFAKWAQSLDKAMIEKELHAKQLAIEADEKNQTIESLSNSNLHSESQIKKLKQDLIIRSDELLASRRNTIERESEIFELNELNLNAKKELVALREQITEQDAMSVLLEKTSALNRSQMICLNDEIVRRGQWGVSLKGELNLERAKFLEITNSNSWRLTWPLRETKRWLTSPSSQLKRYVRNILFVSKCVYQKMPLNYQTKINHRNFIAKHFPGLLRKSGSHPLTIPIFSAGTNKVERQDPIKGELSRSDYCQRASKIFISSSDKPCVSVIIPIFGQVEYTLRCLESIAANLPNVPFEVLVVDDHSPDDSFDILSNISGIRLQRNDSNQGFIRTCNRGAKGSFGEYLYFLNNDTEVTSGWMDSLLRTFEDLPGTGLVGSKLVYPDGRLQEAGGIVWKDGSAWNFGRFQDPQLPEFNYAREVDYCSGASIMVPKVLFDEMNGFDEHYLPAYCEDSDLALKIRDKGYRVIYQPLSRVIHYEGVTSGTDTTQGVKAYQVENSKKLFSRWKTRLETHQPNGHDVDAAKDRGVKRRVLVMDHCTPTPNQDAGSLIAMNTLLLLREMGYQVTFIPEDNLLYMPEYTTELQRSGIEVLYAPYVTSVDKHLAEYGSRYDLVYLFRPGVVERHLKTVRKYCATAKVLFLTADLHFLRMKREADLLADKAKQKEADEMKRRELGVMQLVDGTVVHSTAEMELLAPLIPNLKLYLFPMIIRTVGTKVPFSNRRDIIFVGGYQHTPNVDAAQFFAKEVMPIIRVVLPGVCFHVVGSNPPASVKELAAHDIFVTGFVKELAPLLDKMRVSVAPLRYGAGVKIKVGASMSAGLPVVATSIAAEGMSLVPDENILIADDPVAIAQAILRIYRDAELWSRLSENGIKFAETAWGAEAAWGTLGSIVSDLGLPIERRRYPLSLYCE